MTDVSRKAGRCIASADEQLDGEHCFTEAVLMEHVFGFKLDLCLPIKPLPLSFLFVSELCRCCVRFQGQTFVDAVHATVEKSLARLVEVNLFGMDAFLRHFQHACGACFALHGSASREGCIRMSR